MPNRVSHFEIHADDIMRASNFYREVFGWDIQGWPMPDGTTYWMIMTAPKDSAEIGINGGFIQRPCPAPAGPQGLTGYCCTITVESYDDVAKAILAHGGKEAMTKFALMGIAWQGYFLDTEGNTFGIHQPDVNAR